MKSPSDLEAMLSHKQYMVAIWSILSGSIPAFKSNGGTEGDAFKHWCRGTYEGNFNQNDITKAAHAISTGWTDKFAPSLPTFIAWINNEKKTREIQEQMRSRSNPGPANAEAKAKKKEFLKKWRELADKIQRSPTSRNPGEGDVESFAESYHKLGLTQKLGPLPEGDLDAKR